MMRDTNDENYENSNKCTQNGHITFVIHYYLIKGRKGLSVECNHRTIVGITLINVVLTTIFDV